MLCDFHSFSVTGLVLGMDLFEAVLVVPWAKHRWKETAIARVRQNKIHSIAFSPGDS